MQLNEIKPLQYCDCEDPDQMTDIEKEEEKEETLKTTSMEI